MACPIPDTAVRAPPARRSAARPNKSPASNRLGRTRAERSKLVELTGDYSRLGSAGRSAAESHVADLQVALDVWERGHDCGRNNAQQCQLDHEAHDVVTSSGEPSFSAA